MLKGQLVPLLYKVVGGVGYGYGDRYKLAAVVYRAVAPLVPAVDALVLDSTTLSIEQVIEKALQYARQKLALA